MTIYKEYNFPPEVYIVVSEKELDAADDFENLSRKQIEVALNKEELDECKGARVATFKRIDLVEDELEREDEEAYMRGKEDGRDDAEQELESEFEGREEAIIDDVVNGLMDSQLPENATILRADNLIDELKLDKMRTIFEKMTDQEVDELYDKIKHR